MSQRREEEEKKEKRLRGSSYKEAGDANDETRSQKRERERGRENQNHVYDLSQKKRTRDSRRETKKRDVDSWLP